MQVELIKIDELKPFERNPKKHPEEQIKRIIRSIQEFGWANPILALKENKMVIAGHARLKAAKQMNLAEVPCVLLDMPYEKAIAYVVADNRLAEIAEWDNQMLLPLLDEIKLAGVDVELTGFTAQDISLMNKMEVQEDDFDAEKAAEAIKEPVTKPGDIWILGRHRLMCGSSTEWRDVGKLMDGKKANMIFTDPPWNVAIGQDSNPRHRQREGLKNDNLGKDFPEFLQKFAQNAIKVCDGFIYCVMGSAEWAHIHEALENAGFHWSSTIIWAKDIFVLGRSLYHRQYEPIWFGWNTKGEHQWYGGRDKSDVWFIPRPKVSEEHATMKPLELPYRAISYCSSINSIVLDLFSGGGSTLIACEQSGRISYGMEIEPKYVDVCVQRWEKFTQQKAHKQEVAP